MRRIRKSVLLHGGWLLLVDWAMEVQLSMELRLWLGDWGKHAVGYNCRRTGSEEFW